MAGVYAHIPFCRRKCSYCEFYSVTHFDDFNDFIEAIRRETFLRASFFPHGEGIESVYLGGGTPSLIEPGLLDSLLSSILETFPTVERPEITLEVNPSSVNVESLTSIADIGINRLSIGVQSFDDVELRILERLHTARQARAACDAVAEVGIANIGIDLIYGIPGQTMSSWIQTLSTALKNQTDPSVRV
jgi:oxygen-independent coproporphyrinogen-3 oxidase